MWGVGTVNFDLVKAFNFVKKRVNAKHDREVEQDAAVAQRSEARAKTKIYLAGLYRQLMEQIKAAAAAHDALLG